MGAGGAEMRMRKIVLSPTDYQNHIDVEEVNSDLKEATHVETYTKDEGGFGGDKTIVIFAFYPDERDCQ